MGFIALGPIALSAQDASEPPPVRGKDCDAIWDGPLFGVLPGIGVSMFVAAEVRSCGDTAANDCGTYLAKGAMVGAAAGLLLDKLHCAEKKAPNGLMTPDLSGIPFDPEFRVIARPDSTARSNTR